MQSLHDTRNERVAIDVTNNVVDEFGPEVSSLLRRARAGHLYHEHIVPLQGTKSLVSAVATRTLTWPATGVRALEAEAVAFACIGAIKRALLVPAMASAQNRLNIGLLAATTKSLLESLPRYDCDEVVIFAREGSTMVQTLLAEVGFRPSTQNAVTDDASFVAYAVKPSVLLERLGIADMTEGDVLALRVNASTVVRLGAFHLTVEAAARPYLHGRPEWAEVLTGLAGWGFYPIDGGINTPSAEPALRPPQVDTAGDG